VNDGVPNARAAIAIMFPPSQRASDVDDEVRGDRDRDESWRIPKNPPLSKPGGFGD
jgi:hypothetical protein